MYKQVGLMSLCLFLRVIKLFVNHQKLKKMKKLNSKLFESLKLSDKQAQNTLGGAPDYTSPGSDSALSSTQYDVLFNTYDESGTFQSIDSQSTGAGTKDKPTTLKPSTSLQP